MDLRLKFFEVWNKYRESGFGWCLRSISFVWFDLSSVARFLLFSHCRTLNVLAAQTFSIGHVCNTFGGQSFFGENCIFCADNWWKIWFTHQRTTLILVSTDWYKRQNRALNNLLVNTKALKHLSMKWPPTPKPLVQIW